MIFQDHCKCDPHPGTIKEQTHRMPLRTHCTTRSSSPSIHIRRSKMARPKPFLLLLAAAMSLLVLPRLASCADPVLFPVAKDAATSLYTIPLRDAANHVIDLAGPLVWSTCADDHLAVPYKCSDPVCKIANAYQPPGCSHAGRHCKDAKRTCKAYPYNPVTGKCAAGKLIHTRFIANTTDGKKPLSQVAVRAVGACAPPELLPSLPSGAAGVAGLAGSGLALPAQVGASHGVAKKFLLCLPRRGHGVAIFGGGPFFLPEQSTNDLVSTLAYTPLHSRKGNPLYYISVTGIAVNQARLPVSGHALATGGVVLCSRVPYTALRPDVYRSLADAFERALARGDAKVPAVAPFQLCYRSSMLGNTLLGYAVPDITLTLEGGKNWTFTGSSSMVDVNAQTACLAFGEMKGVKPRDGSVPAVVVGGFQMENYLLQFDLVKQQLGFARVPVFTSCSNFNFKKSY
ncbi:hypothetical protein ACP70R_036106 [Stipagrostis hirtigluma subsp. patula]